jgi:hypothetical protein
LKFVADFLSGKDLQTAVNEAIKLYQATEQKAEQEKIPVAPMELK